MAAGFKTGGRKPGSVNKKTAERAAQLAATAERLKTALPTGAWEGDAVSLAQAVYKNPDQPWEVRLHCMRLAAAYERPALSAIAVKDVSAAPAIEPMLSIRDIIAMGRPQPTIEGKAEAEPEKAAAE